LRLLTFTLFRSATDTAGQPISLSWEDWLQQYMSHHSIRGTPADKTDEKALKKHKNGPALVLGEMPPGSRHVDKLVRSTHALAIDVDGQPDEVVAKMLAVLEPFEYAAWTTHRHGAESAQGRAKLRVVLPLAEPLEPVQHAGAWQGLNRLIDGINDPATKNIGRLHFLPSTFDPAVAELTHHGGRWLAFEDLPEKKTEPKASVSEQKLEPVTRSLEVFRVRKKLRADKSELKDAIAALLDGRSFENDPHQHDMVLTLTFKLAYLSQALTSDDIEELFAPSLAVMLAADPTAPPMIDVINAYNGAVKKIRESEAQQESQRRDEKREQGLAEQVKVAAPGSTRYTQDDLKRIASANKWEVEELRDRWIIQKEGACWMLSETGDYIGPFSRFDVPAGLSRVLARAPVQLVEVTKSGIRYRPPIDVVRESGTIAAEIHSDMTLQRTYFDPVTKVLHEAIRPIRKLDPVFNSEIDGWLKILAGEAYPKLIDWLSCVMDLNKLLCALYFSGAPSSGKTLLATGLAKIWTEGSPGSITKVLSDFNDEFTRCPLVLADEEVPKNRYSTATSALRSMLSTTERTLSRKFQPTSSLRGAVRLILAANNESLLHAEISSSNDLEAIAQRFLYIEAPLAAAELLNEIPRSKREMWAQEGIAKHTMWLAENHKVVEPGQRFWVEGNASEMTNRMMSDSKWNSLVCEWLVRYLLNPKPLDTKCTGMIRRGEMEDGELLVNDQAVVDGWELYIKTKESPITAFIGAALRAISKTSKRCNRRLPASNPAFKSKQIRYRVIDVERLISWADRFNVGTQEDLQYAVSQKNYLNRKAKEQRESTN
jgi:hypothetical protein